MIWLFKILLALITIGSAFYGGIVYEQANQTRIELIVEKSADAASKAAAEAIAGIEIKQTTINNKVREVIRTETVYSDCRHSPDMFKLIKDKFK